MAHIEIGRGFITFDEAAPSQQRFRMWSERKLRPSSRKTRRGDLGASQH